VYAACAFVTLVFVCVLPVVAHADVDVAVSAEDGILYVDARVAGVFDEELDRALRSGLPARAAVELVLWEQRAGIWDREALRDQWQVSVVFDVVEEVYRVLDESGRLMLETSDLAAVEEVVAGIEFWPLCEIADIDADESHYLGVRFTIEPLSVEEVRDLERWLRGNVREGARLRDVPGQLVGVLRSRLGLGGQTDRGRSVEFRPSQLPPPD
jgi:hypothetical protein